MADNAVRRLYLTTVTFQDSTGTVTFTLQNLAGGAGRRSASNDFWIDADEAPDGYDVELDLTAGFETAPALGDRVELYINEFGSESSAGVGTMDDGNADGALSSTNKLTNLVPVLVLQADEAAADIPMAGRARIEVASRHWGVVVMNRSADNLQNTANTSIVRVYPWVFEVQ